MRLLESGEEAFSAIIDGHPGSPHRGEAWFWRAMISIERGNSDAAEADLTRMMDDPDAAGSRESALLGWALSLEKRGELDRAETYLDSLLSENPGGRLSTDARLRSASIALRKGDVARAGGFLRETSPATPAQEEEYLLLSGETAYRNARYSDAAVSFGKLSRENPDGPLAPSAELGLAWAYIRQGKYDDARAHLDSLATRNDSVGIAALYQGGVLSLLRNNIFDALAAFDTLTYRSPYDRYAERAYFQMGMIQYRSRRFREARKNFSFAARLFPESPLRPLSYRMLGESNMAVNDFSNARYAFSRVRKMNGSGELVEASMFKEGISLYHLGRFRTGESGRAGSLALAGGGPLSGQPVRRSGAGIRAGPLGTLIGRAQVHRCLRDSLVAFRTEKIFKRGGGVRRLFEGVPGRSARRRGRPAPGGLLFLPRPV
jgi:TolA-binding protein